MVDNGELLIMTTINKNIIWIVGILLIGIVVGAVVVTRPIIERVVYENDYVEPGQETDIWEMDCNGEHIEIEWKSYSAINNQYDKHDVNYLMRKSCDGIVTNLQLNGDYWLSNEFGEEGFDETELKISACEKQNTKYDPRSDECIGATAIGVEE